MKNLDSSLLQSFKKLLDLKNSVFLGMLLLLLSASNAAGQTLKASDMIPRPIYCLDKEGHFTIQNGLTISAPAAFSDAAALLNEELFHREGILLSGRKNATVVFIKSKNIPELNEEGYELDIAPEKISIKASSARGALNAVFSLMQLQLLQSDRRLIPCAQIKDAPRFGYRGMHLDVSRHFFPVDFIKKYIDLMALYKYNTFHWHLTDGPGWRLEIKKYPLLTSEAAFRTHNTWKEWWGGERRYSREGAPNAYGGYYTQEDAKEIVAYAAKRGITVIPEIEMPGHSEAVLTAYPKLSCPGEPYSSGEFCIGNPGTYQFLEDVLDEVMELFPSEYIHIGGDEAGHQHWKNCSRCQELKNEKGLKDEHELQAYLIRHFNDYLQSHNRKLIGWDEIVDGGLPTGAIVMDWRGNKSGIKAAQQGHQVIVTTSETYFDKYQSNPVTQPEAFGGFLPITMVYEFEPVPSGLSPEQEKYYIGTQANLWSEYMPSTYQVEYMAWPRAAALSEVAWSPKEGKDYDYFHHRLQSHYRLLQRMNVNYYRPSTYLTVAAHPDTERGQNKIAFQSEQYKPEIRYTTDGSTPDVHSAVYNEPFHVPGKTEIKAVLFEDGEPKGDVCSYTSHYHKAIGRKVKYNNPWSSSYPAREKQTLTNGVHGSLTYQDKEWLGFLRDIDVVIDMEQVQPLTSVSVRFMHQPGPGVHLPGHVELLFSDDGIEFHPVGKLVNEKGPEKVLLDFETFSFNCENKPARFIRLVAPNVMRGYMFIDEIVVY